MKSKLAGSMCIMAMLFSCSVFAGGEIEEIIVVQTQPYWTGFYAGVSLGGEDARSNWTTTSVSVVAPGFVIPPPTVDGSSPRRFDGSSGRFGGFAGYDYQFAPQWVAGVVIDPGVKPHRS